ncbi:MAG: hypothetical protein K0R43_222 [Pseudoduganella sp.]|jgi:hypothetical protein|nr:hypothetical protein [Pseudoduganella sp.]
MTIVPPPRHRLHRRILAVGVATVALHAAMIDWVSGRIGATDIERPATPAVITAALHAPPPPVAAAPAPKPAEAPRPRARKPKPAAPPVDAPVAAPATPEPAPVAEPEPEPAPPPAVQSGAASAAAEVESAQPEAVAPQEVPAGTRRWKVELPPSARLELDVKRKDADGTNWSGSATIVWQQDGAAYKATQEVGISLLIARVNLLEVSSEGVIDDYGIAPAKFTEKRRNRSATNTHFNQQEQKITFSASERTVPLLSGAQDRATVLFQLAGIGRADVNQYGQDIEVLVGEDRKAEIYRFQLVGEEELETAMGKLVTWHIVRPPRPGSYNTRLDIWLAPSLDWYPVQIRNTEASGAITTQTVTRIIK